MMQKIIDIHTHIGLYENYYNLSITHFELLLNEFPIERVFCVPTSWSESVNDSVVKTIETAPNKIRSMLSPILWINPLRQEANNMLKKANDYVAIKLHPFVDRYDFLPNLLLEFFNSMEKYQKPICIHTGNAGCTPDVIERGIPESYSKPIILFHSRPIKEAVLLAKKRTNVFLECSFVSPQDIEYAVSEIGEEKILFGSDYPIQCAYYWGIDILHLYKKNINELFEITEKKGISNSFFYNNAIKVFNLDSQV